MRFCLIEQIFKNTFLWDAYLDLICTPWICWTSRYVEKRMSSLAPGLVPIWMVRHPGALDNVTVQGNSSVYKHTGNHQSESLFGEFCSTHISLSLWKPLPWKRGIRLSPSLLLALRQNKTPHQTGGTISYIWRIESELRQRQRHKIHQSSPTGLPITSSTHWSGNRSWPKKLLARFHEAK